MYGGLDKGGGGVVGSGADPFLSNSSTHEQNVEDIVGSAAGDETICCQEEDGTKAFLSARISPITGEVQWVKSYDEEAVMRRTLGMNLMTSMLHDADRNDVYERAISIIIRDFCETHGRAPTVLDIGTGTGLLAMLAVKHGASYVIACEMFEAMADVAREVIEVNGLSDQILVVTAKSSEIDGLPFAPDILISELLDSALLGEGILLSHSDAISRLMDTAPASSASSTPSSTTDTFASTVDNTNNMNATSTTTEVPPPPPVTGIEDNQSSCHRQVVPYGGRVYGTAVSGAQIRHMCRVQGLEGHLGGARPWRRSALDSLGSSSGSSGSDGDGAASAHAHAQHHAHSTCGGGSKMIPVHWEQQACPLPSCNDPLCPLSHCLSAPTEIMNFEFFHSHNPAESCFQQTISATKDGNISGILVWWTVNLLPPELDPDRTVSYSTQPGVQNWQDHWQQVIFPLPHDHPCSIGDEFELTSAHDGVHIWLELQPINKRKLTEYQVASPLLLSPKSYFSPRLCECGWHILHNSERMQMLNDSGRMHAWELGIQDLVSALLGRERQEEGEEEEVTRSTHQVAGSIIDLSDGSILALMAATALQKQKQKQKRKGSDEEDEEEGGLQVLSLERKDYSHLFSTQLCMGNELQDTLEVVDLQSWQEIKEEWISNQASNMDEKDSGDELTISAIISECFYYQLHAQPIHSALSFYFSLRELAAVTAASARSERVLVCPSAARVMVAAFELTQLQVNHGIAGNPCGFTHAPLDKAQAGWQDHWFPYKLGMYAKKLLTTPVCVTRLDYQALFDNKSGDNEPTESSTDQLSNYSSQTPMHVVASGTCHCVALWVDLEVSPGVYISHWADGSAKGNECNFPPYLKTNVKFFEEKQQQPTTTTTSVHAHSDDDSSRTSDAGAGAGVSVSGTDEEGAGRVGVVGREITAGSVIKCNSELMLDSALIELDFEF